MLFGKKCSLCGGALDRNLICKECGLDNSKSEKHYRINRSRCDDEPLTHVHTENAEQERESRKAYEAWERENKRAYKAQERENKRIYEAQERANRRDYEAQENMGGQAYSAVEDESLRMPQGKKASSRSIGKIIRRLVILIIVVNVAFTVIGTVITLVTSQMDSVTTTTERSNPYETLEEDSSAVLADDGESVKYELSAGTYIVGVHIPEGLYQAQTKHSYDSVQVQDSAHGIYLYEYEGREDGNYLDDLRLFSGARVNIDTNETITLTSDNASAALESEANPLTEVLILQDEEIYVAGEDFEPGIYDVSSSENYTYLSVTIYDEEGEYQTIESVSLGESGNSYHYLVLPEGAEISTDEGDTITLTPTEEIASTDYFEFYESY